MRSLAPDHAEFKQHLTMSVAVEPFEVGNELNGRAECVVSSTWMAASFQNALKAIKDSSIVVKGFRPGKAPQHILRSRKTPLAIDTMRDWILQDLTAVLAAEPGFQVVSPVTFSFDSSWKEGESLKLEATFTCWECPAISIDTLSREIAEKARAEGVTLAEDTALFGWLKDALAQKIAPSLSDELIAITARYQFESERIEGANPETLRNLVLQGFGVSLLIKLLGVHATKEALEKFIGEVAAQEGMSFLDLYDGLIAEGGVDIYRHHVEAQIALLELLRRARDLGAAQGDRASAEREEIG